MTGFKLDKELEEFRSLTEVPSEFHDGFSISSLVGAVFIALLMVPGAMYMNLLAGMGVGPAAQWVTVILFIEVARRAHKTLDVPQIFVLFYMAGATMATPFFGLLFNQFFVHSDAAVGFGVAEKMEEVFWFAPTDPDVLAQRNFFHPAWYPALGMVIFQTLMGRLKGTILGYGMFRIASDIERLPFPMAPIAVQGIMALAEQQSEEAQRNTEGEVEGGWRWRIFSVGGVLGLGFGAVYMALPAISGALLGTPIQLLPIPFVDFTAKTSEYLPAVATGLSLNVAQFIIGMVLPFWAMLGGFIGFIITAIANPIMYNYGILRTWAPGDETVLTLFKNNIDFYFSFTIGVSLAVAVAGIIGVVANVLQTRRQKRENAETLNVEDGRAPGEIPPGRGDIPSWIIILVYIVSSSTYILLSGWLIDWHPGVMVVLLFFAFLYTPIISYVTARLEGLCGQVVEIPMVREAAFLLSGYQGGVKIWFLPVPIADYGQRTNFYKKAELTGTSFWSVWKAEILLVPIVVLSSILFAQFIWSLGPVPSAAYPFAQKMWELNAANRCIMYSATLGMFSQFEESFNVTYLGIGCGLGLFLFFTFQSLGLPVLLVYGLVRGLNQTLPHVVIPQFLGAMAGRFYFQPRYGPMWRKYIPVVSAGFQCGMGLVTVLAVGVNFLAKSVIKIPF